MSRLKDVTRSALPPAVWSRLQWLRHESGLFGAPEWEYVQEGWAASEARGIRGWDGGSVARVEAARWPDHMEQFADARPLGVAKPGARSSEADLRLHNLWVSHAYVLTLAARTRDRISILDWGGQLGQFAAAARALLPEVDVRFEVKEVPSLCEAGRRLQPDVLFHADETTLKAHYDLVLSSNSFQYSADWHADLALLAGLAAPYLHLTRLPVVLERPSFVTLQRAYRYGYDTEYLGWFYNRRELVEAAAQRELTLEREFVFGPHPRVAGAPEQAEVRGYLFRRERV
jgi:putative methyltransferase (TIGR04325 family)